MNLEAHGFHCPPLQYSAPEWKWEAREIAENALLDAIRTTNHSRRLVRHFGHSIAIAQPLGQTDCPDLMDRATFGKIWKLRGNGCSFPLG